MASDAQAAYQQRVVCWQRRWADISISSRQHQQRTSFSYQWQWNGKRKLKEGNMVA